MKIPVTMCHGTSDTLPLERFTQYFAIAAELGFTSINYDDLERARADLSTLPEHPIMFDFDHPVRSIHDQILPLMTERGYTGNIFIQTQPMEELYATDAHKSPDREHMTWEEIAALHESGWQIGAHTHTHPNLSDLSQSDPTGRAIRDEMQTNDDILTKHLGFPPKDFAFTGTSFSAIAERQAKQRYRFGRLWIIGANYEADGKPIRVADLLNVPGPDEADSGPPHAARYITAQSDPHRLPAMELENLIHDYTAFRNYLTGALQS